MSEQYPLLCEEVSEEEVPSTRYRGLLMSKERARIHVKGAAVIISRWPRQWTQLLSYWWIGIGMLALTTYFLYSIFYTDLAHSYNIPYYHSQFESLEPRNFSPVIPALPLKVFMHIFPGDKKVVDADDYMPYIKILTNKFKNLEFELIIVSNDDEEELSDKVNNELALNSLWDDNSINQVVNNNENFKIKYVSFTQCFHDSPLKWHFKKLPQQLKQFLVRAASIWQKGGIAFDPIILTPKSPNDNYIDKIYSVLNKYKMRKTKVKENVKSRSNYRKLHEKPNQSTKTLPNNIRDIINALEKNSVVEKSSQESLVEAETIDVSRKAYKRSIRSIAEVIATDIDQSLVEKKPNTRYDTTIKEKQTDSWPKHNILSKFWEYLFHNKQTKNEHNATSHSKNASEKENNPNKTLVTNFWNEMLDINKYKPVVISAEGNFDKLKNDTEPRDMVESEVEDTYEVTIDLKGYIVATDTACHAFIGSILTNSIHHSKSETATDFIIKELSNFCMELLASCTSIDVILL